MSVSKAETIEFLNKNHESDPHAFIMKVTQNRSLSLPAKVMSNLVLGGSGIRDAIHAQVKQLEGVRGMTRECVVLTI